MTSTQSRRAREGVAVPNPVAVIDAVKRKPKIAQSDGDDGHARTAAGGFQERAAATSPQGHLGWEDDGEPDARLPRQERGRRAPQRLRPPSPLTPGQEPETGMADFTSQGRVRPHVVVVGGGFAGLAAVHGLRDVDVDVTLIDRHTYNTVSYTHLTLPTKRIV